MPKAINHTPKREGKRAWRKQEQDNRTREGVKGQEGRKWYSLIDKIWAKANLEEAFKEVKRNRGAAGSRSSDHQGI